MIGERNREEFELLGYHDVSVQHEAWDDEKHRRAQEWLKEQKASLEREIGRQTSQSREKLMKLPDPLPMRQATRRPQHGRRAGTARAALAIATIALLVSIITPEKITAYLSSKPWASWVSQ